MKTKMELLCSCAVALAATNFGCASASLDGTDAENEGQRPFTAKLALTSCAWGPGAYLRAGDYNNNGTLDLLSPNGSVMNTFTAPFFNYHASEMSINLWGDSGYTFVGDFNKDGKADMASASGGNIYVKMSNGTDFAHWTSTVANLWGGPAVTVTNWPVANKSGGSGYTFAADFDNDGDTDIASINGSNIYMKLAEQQPSFHFRDANWGQAVSWGQPGYTFAADFNADGKADIATANGDRITLLISTGNGFASPYIITGMSNWGTADFTFAADFDGDGKADIASASGGNIYMKWSSGNGFTRQTSTVSNQWASSTGYTFVADFDRNGTADIASANGGNVYMKLARLGRNGFDSPAWPVSGFWGTAAYTRAGQFDSSVPRYPGIVTASGCTIVNYVSTGIGFAQQTY